MELTSEEIIAVVLALVSAVLWLFRRSDKIQRFQFEGMKVRQAQTEEKLIACESNHATTNTQIFELNGKLEHELGKRAAAEDIAEKIIDHIDRQIGLNGR